MSLIVPKPPSFAHCTSNIESTPNISYGALLTAGAANVKGSTVGLLSALTHDVEYIVINFLAGANPSATVPNVLADIMVDPAGGTSWSSTPLIPDLLGGWARTSTATYARPRTYHFPVFVKAGTSIGARIQSSIAALTYRIGIFAYGGNRNPTSWWCGTQVTAIGTNSGTSRGTDHTAGTSGAFSAWTNLGSATSHPCRALQFAVGGNADNTANSDAKQFEFGIGSTRIGPPVWQGSATTEELWYTQTGPIWYSAPAGTQFQVRGTCSGTAEAQDVAIYMVH